MGFKVENQPAIPNQKVEVKEKKLDRAEAIRICKEKYPKEYKWKRVLALSIVIGAIALLVIPLTATALAALSVCTFEVGLLIAGPIALIGIGILIKAIDNKTIYWSGDVARYIIKKHEEKERKEAKKAQKFKVEA